MAAVTPSAMGASLKAGSVTAIGLAVGSFIENPVANAYDPAHEILRSYASAPLCARSFSKSKAMKEICLLMFLHDYNRLCLNNVR